MSPKTITCIPFTAMVLGLYACQTTRIELETAKEETRWFNLEQFESADSIGTTPYDLEFDIAYTGIDGDIIHITNCFQATSLGNSGIAEREFARWNLLNVNCEAAKRFYEAPESAVTYWPSTFDFSLIKTFPGTAIPYLGGQGLDGRSETLGKHASSLALIQSGKNSIEVSHDGLVVKYVLLAQGDFNRDGYQDLFVRMDWYTEGAFGKGHDWVVLTRTSPNTAPMMLWRK
ncbi:hypothetical protein [Halopseudomonas salegens]|uniref:Uncharacterized protein n=1 Tax=Halopseudomonas salegens TaxID=1434072 RepID=A0A1H2HK00_9GAMM|nr:hypothetical protein [Halopseudomonas salegens]SDU32220.1 hypothetical protein SAMN05216210_3103 [Halopseudomonas salegens]